MVPQRRVAPAGRMALGRRAGRRGWGCGAVDSERQWRPPAGCPAPGRWHPIQWTAL